jgi:predicted glycoside hydrolase/deacetylase ChbG (UPF0249 family)
MNILTTLSYLEEVGIMQRQLIVTADDYGMCDSVNRAIEECMAAGTVKATCVMINMPANEQTASLRQWFPHCSIGIHWTLTEGRPILPPEQVPSLVQTDKTFHSAQELRRRWNQRRMHRAEVKAELCAQYTRFCEVADLPDFWNTHENFHVWPGLFNVCVALGQELHIRAMRSHRRFTVPRVQTVTAYHWRHPLYWVKGTVLGRWAKRVAAQGMLMPDGRVYMPGYSIDKASLEDALRRLPWHSVTKAVEVIIHPAIRVEDVFGALTESRLREYAMYKEPNLATSLMRLGVKPVSFEALQGFPQ